MHMPDIPIKIENTTLNQLIRSVNKTRGDVIIAIVLSCSGWNLSIFNYLYVIYVTFLYF